MTEKQPPDDWQAYRDVIASVGSPEQLRKKLEALERLIEQDARRTWLFSLIKAFALWLVPVLAAWQIFKETIVSWFAK